ncbi:tetratricopeptide repeat protein [Nocardiopsis flavescens]|uniref:CHAT domain-containing tetratricopeptide repeat protein n=1 Tax=Nocardiopsis flavescens TaxID=758803 RepID=UPI003667E058
MIDRLIVDITPEGTVAVSVHWANEIEAVRIGEPVDVDWPLDAPALGDLRWYLEDYLSWPFGAYADKGPAVAKKMNTWGTALFDEVLGRAQWREAYGALRARGSQAEIVIQSASPLHLGLPWELLHDPLRDRPLVLDGIGIVRSLPTNPLEPAFPLGREDLRVLMVISRPAGDRDVGYRLIARPLLERLEAVRGKVDLVVLRPATLDRLREVLAQAVREGRPFQVVHFDGHGAFGTASSAEARWDRNLFQGDIPQGMLAFEKPGGGTDLVPAGTVAAVLAQGQVPVVVLNACQSGQLEAVAEAAIATRLIQDRVASVIAMAYSVYTHAAAEFMAAFYERLFAGDRVADAVTAGRRQLALHDKRPSPKGALPFKDWVVPVHYRRSDISLPGLATDRAGMDPFQDILDRHRDPGSAPVHDEGVWAPEGVFVGRDSLFHALESALPHQKVVVLHGPAGTGKTELAKAFGRWWRDTRGVDDPALVFWYSFRPGTHASFSLDGVIGQIGMQVFGAKFSVLEAEQRRSAVEELLEEHRCMLVWDNFETAHTLPDATSATPPLGEAERDRITAFLGRVARGSSALVITSRTPEHWLGDVRRIEVGALTQEEANDYTDQLLAPYPNTLPKRQGEAFADLLRWLDGHPMSMKLVLPLLETTEPDALLEGLRGTTPLPGRHGDGSAADRDTSLSASITYSFTHLSPADQQALTALSLFHTVADSNVLALLSQVEGVPDQFHGHSDEDWEHLLERATGIGLLTRIGADMYRMHPALPAYLTDLWRTTYPEKFTAQRTVTADALLDAFANLSVWLIEQVQGANAEVAVAVTATHQTNLSHQLGYALEHHRWEQAQVIIQALDGYWELRGIEVEAQAWADRIRSAVEADHVASPRLDTPAGALWLFTVGAEANRYLNTHRLDEAHDAYNNLLTALQEQPVSDQQRARLANVYYHLGIIAQGRRHLDEAENWHHQALTINEQLDNPPGMAAIYHQLGNNAQLRGHLNDAENWYHRALRIIKELNKRPTISVIYHQLGNTAQMREDLDEAETWYRRSLAIEVELGNLPGMASAYHHLGITAQESGRLDDAEAWYHQALTINEQLGNPPGIAAIYHQLGITAKLRGHLNDAENWYHRALTIKKELDNIPGIATTYGELGLLREKQGRLQQALEWMIRCVALFPEFPHPSTGPAPMHLVRLAQQLGMPALEQTWHMVTDRPLPSTVRAFVLAND